MWATVDTSGGGLPGSGDVLAEVLIEVSWIRWLFKLEVLVKVLVEVSWIRLLFKLEVLVKVLAEVSWIRWLWRMNRSDRRHW